MTEQALEEAGLFEGDQIHIKGKRGKKTVASVAVVADADVITLSDGSDEDDKTKIAMFPKVQHIVCRYFQVLVPLLQFLS